jgi:hypothetical protein
MEDKRKNNGGHKSAGRKPKVDEQKVNTLFVNALKELYNTETDDEAKKTFVKNTLMDSQRGQIFIAEHIFGKPKETVETTHKINKFNIKEFFNFDNAENPTSKIIPPPSKFT